MLLGHDVHEHLICFYEQEKHLLLVSHCVGLARLTVKYSFHALFAQRQIPDHVLKALAPHLIQRYDSQGVPVTALVSGEVAKHRHVVAVYGIV